MNIICAGVGGQGTVLASRLLAQCAINRGEAAHTAETIGMAQRGGSVVSHVRIGGGVYAPLIPKGMADLLIGFEPAEAVRCFEYLKPGGCAVVSKRPVRPAADMLSGAGYDPGRMLDFLKASVGGRLVLVDAEQVARESASTRSLNVALLGASAHAGALPFTRDEIAAAIRLLLRPRFVEAGIDALALGARCAEMI